MAAIKLYYNKTTYQLIGIDDGGISIVVGDTGTKEFWFYFGTGATVAAFVNDSTIPANYLGRVVIARADYVTGDTTADGTISGELYLTPMNGTSEGYYKLIVNEWLSAVEGNADFTARLKVSDGNGGYTITNFSTALIPIEAGTLPGDDTITLVQYNAIMDAVDAVIAGTTPIAYDNAASGLLAITLDEAVDELALDVDQLQLDRELVANKVTAWQTPTTDTAYPSEKLVKDNLDLKELLVNKVTDFTDADNTKYPSALAVKTELDLKEILTNKAVNFNTLDDTKYPTTSAVDDSYIAKTANPVKSVSMNATTYIITVTYYDDTTATYDIPAEMAFVSATYDNDTKDITFTLQNAQTIVVPLDDILTGLASTAWVEANNYNKTDSDARFEALANKVIAFSPVPNDTNYPSEKLVYDELDRLEDLIVAADTDAEVISARGDYVSLGDRLDDLNDGVEVVDTVSLRVDSTYGSFAPMNGGSPLVKEISGRTIPALENLLTAGGDFASGWTITTATGTVSGGVYPFTATAQNGGISQAFTQVSGNIYYIVARVKASSVNVKMQVNGEATSIVAHGGTSAYQVLVARYTASSSGSVTFQVIDTNTSGWAQVDVDYAMVHNLTAKFGSSLEPTTAVMDEIVASLGTSGYISTTARTSVTNTQVKAVGKNLLSTTFEQGDLSGTTGLALTSTTRVRSGFIDVSHFSNYYLKSNNASIWIGSAFYYDSNYNFISRPVVGLQGYSLVKPTNTKYFKFTIGDNTFTLNITPSQVENTFQLEQGTVATTYEAYVSETQLFTHTELHQLPNLVADKLRYDNGAYVRDNYVQEYTLLSGDIDSVTTGTNLQYVTIGIGALSGVITQTASAIDSEMRVTGFIEVAAIDGVGNTLTFVTDTTNLYLQVALGTYADVAAAQTALAGTKILYQLATPLLANSIIDVDGTLIQGTVTTVEQLQNIPTTYKLEYAMNVEQTTKTLVERDKVQQLEIDNLETDVATRLLRLGGTTALRTTSPTLYQMYFDTTLNVPIWWNGTNWVNHAGTTV